MLTIKLTKDLGNKYIYFDLADEKQKTQVWDIINKRSEEPLGRIEWYPQWRHYCFFPTIELETVHSDRCLLSISKFITELNEMHKLTQISKKTNKES